MPRPLPVLFAIASAALAASEPVSAQTASRAPLPVSQQASMLDGRVQGLVRDDIGRAVVGASIMALGTTMAFARSDDRGHFSLALVPGDYVLRATRDGYVSTYRELIRIQTSALIERTITVARAGSPAAVAAKPDDYSPSEVAWRLRHLTPTALRDVSPVPGLDDHARPVASPFRSAPLLATAALNGQLNFLTTGSWSSSSGWLPSQLPRAIASVAVGAPVGSFGDWTVRGAMANADLSSWVLLGEYHARDRRAHAFTVGASYSTQIDPATLSASATDAVDGARTVGGLYGFDRWQVSRGLELNYGMRLDRYDYVDQAELLSPRLGARIAVLPGTHLTLSSAQRLTAPGADEFLPPASAGPWLPPERTFAPLISGTRLQAERIRRYEVGLEQEFGSGARRPSLGIMRFRELALDQTATLFGLEPTPDSAHYYVANPGSVDVDGWTVRVSGGLTSRLRGTVDYSISSARWLPGLDADAIADVAASVVRPERERLHDLTTSIETNVPETSTRIRMCYRANTAFGPAGSTSGLFADGRFDLEVRQALPYRPLRGSRLELMFAIRSLFHDGRDMGSFYDELLTIRPPMRIIGGLQVKF